MRKFHDFSITQILREINFEDSRCTKSAILSHLEAQNFDFYEFVHVLKALPNQQNSEPPKMAKEAFLGLLDFPKLVSRKI